MFHLAALDFFALLFGRDLTAAGFAAGAFVSADGDTDFSKNFFAFLGVITQQFQ